MGNSLDKRKRVLQKRAGVLDDGIIGTDTITAFERVFDEQKRLHITVVNAMKYARERWGASGEHADLVHILADAHEQLGLSLGDGMVISRASRDALIGFEISSKGYYNKLLKKPTWPGWSSGVTVGVGYDLGHTPKTRIKADWQGRVPDRVLEAFLSVSGITGERAKPHAQSLANRGIEVPYDLASAVFSERTLPYWAERVMKVYPGVEDLPPDAQGAVLSLVYNRGSSMANSSRRREMRDLRGAVADGDLDRMSDLILSMRRLWSKSSGLYPRRTKEAALVKGSRRAYSDPELIRL